MQGTNEAYDYTGWSLYRFRKECEQLRENEWTASTQEVYQFWHRLLVPTEQAFQTLHPRAYQTWLREQQGE